MSDRTEWAGGVLQSLHSSFAPALRGEGVGGRGAGGLVYEKVASEWPHHLKTQELLLVGFCLHPRKFIYDVSGSIPFPSPLLFPCTPDFSGTYCVSLPGAGPRSTWRGKFCTVQSWYDR